MGQIVIYYNNTFSKESRELMKECALVVNPNVSTFQINNATTIGEAVKWIDDNTDYFITLEKSSHIEHDTVFLSSHDADGWLNDYFKLRGFEIKQQKSMYTVNSHVKYSCIYIVLCGDTKHTGKDLIDIIVDLATPVKEKQQPDTTFTVKEKYDVVIKTSSEDEAIRICKHYRSGKVYDENGNVVYKTEAGKLPVVQNTAPVKRIKTVPNKAFQKVAKKHTIK